jgi:hypothetical protein
VRACHASAKAMWFRSSSSHDVDSGFKDDFSSCGEQTTRVSVIGILQCRLHR